MIQKYSMDVLVNYKGNYNNSTTAAANKSMVFDLSAIHSCLSGSSSFSEFWQKSSFICHIFSGSFVYRQVGKHAQLALPCPCLLLLWSVVTSVLVVWRAGTTSGQARHASQIPWQLSAEKSSKAPQGVSGFTAGGSLATMCILRYLDEVSFVAGENNFFPLFHMIGHSWS